MNDGTMNDDHAEPKGPGDSVGDAPSALTLQKERRMLELELIKIRNEARAARLDARAAEIEWMIQRLRGSRQSVGNDGELAAPHFPTSSPQKFSSWDEVRAAISVDNGDSAKIAAPVTAPITGTQVGLSEPEAVETDSIGHTEMGEVSADVCDDQADTAEVPGDEPSTDQGVEAKALAGDAMMRMDSAESQPRRPRFLDLESDQEEHPIFNSGDLPDEIAIAEDDPEVGESSRPRPLAFLISGLAHVLILMVLAVVGIRSHQPRDQVAISGSVTPASESMMESFEIESTDPQTEPTETEPSEVQYDISPVGELAVSEFTSESNPAPPTSAAAAMTPSSSANVVQSLKSDSELKTQFCGVEGGGNHFVYLVDSSKSMGDAFDSARRELLASIDSLNAKQRFYVILYDKEPDYMRLGSGGDREPRSVYATAENKAAVRRWAMQIKMDRGWAPYDPMQFALGLKPDVIFLLSDGEFPQKFEDLVKTENRVVNLFGDAKPISIVHTISYFSKEGESRMRRIANQNQGQYRHVPKP